MKKSCYVKTYYGFGDNIWQLPFITQLSLNYGKIYLETYFPFVFRHLENIVFIDPSINKKVGLKTCNSSLLKYKSMYSNMGVPSDAQTIKFPYYLTEFKKGINMVEGFSTAVNPENKFLNSPLIIKEEYEEQAKKMVKEWKNKWPNKKICLIRPPSNRKDWSCSARVPNPEYFQLLINKYNQDFIYISVGNKSIDTYVKDLRGINFRYDWGELDLELIMAITKEVDLMITYNCFIFPLGVYNKTPTFVIGGGFSDPKMYLDSFRMDLQHIYIVTPFPICKCYSLKHNCNLTIDEKYLQNSFETLLKNNDLLSRRN